MAVNCRGNFWMSWVSVFWISVFWLFWNRIIVHSVMAPRMIHGKLQQGNIVLVEANVIVIFCQVHWTWVLTFLKSHHCSFSDGSTYDSWKASTGKYSISGGERHCDILSSPLDMGLTNIDFGSDLISFEVELPCAPTLKPIDIGETRVPDPFAGDFLSVNSSVRSINR